MLYYEVIFKNAIEADDFISGFSRYERVTTDTWISPPAPARDNALPLHKQPHSPATHLLQDCARSSSTWRNISEDIKGIRLGRKPQTPKSSWSLFFLPHIFLLCSFQNRNEAIRRARAVPAKMAAGWSAGRFVSRWIRRMLRGGIQLRAESMLYTHRHDQISASRKNTTRINKRGREMNSL